jgi:diguanylate cyclase (GGDEF)-like protein
VYDKYGWKVFLGYDDLELLTHKFKYLADTKEIYSAMDYWTEYRLKIDDVTSLLNKKGFIQECEKELCRYLRYGSDFSFAVFNFNFPKYSNTGSKETVNDYFKQAAYLMKKHIRDTDTIARWDDNNIIIMFTETTRAGAHKASKKIKTLLTSSILKNICIPKINIAVVEHNGQNITGSIEKCFALLRSADTGEEKIS